MAVVCTALRAVAARHGIDITLPWNFVTVEEFEASLAATGFEVLFVCLVPRPTSLPSGIFRNACIDAMRIGRHRFFTITPQERHHEFRLMQVVRGWW